MIHTKFRRAIIAQLNKIWRVCACARADLIISHSLKTEWKILENTKGRLKEEIFLFFLIPFQEDYSIAFKLILKLGVLQD